MGKNKVVSKIIQYKLRKGTSEATFLKASDTLMPELAKLSGFIKCELFKDENKIKGD